MRKAIIVSVLGMAALASMGQSECGPNTSDKIQRQQSEKLLEEATAQTGMPAITNFRERKLVKDLFELRDQDGLTTYTYLFSELNGKLVKFCDSVGYGIPFSTQYTNPEKPMYNNSATATIAQAEPNGLFSPATAEGTWIMCSNPSNGRAQAVYVEPRTVVSPFPIGQ